jgi:hypothetical protein
MPPKPLPPTGEIILYTAPDGLSRVECRFAGETVWLTQALMSQLFQKDVRTINEHLQNLFEEGELSPEATIRKFRIVRIEGQREVARVIEHYNLDAILAVGYRVRSTQGTRFRRWATDRLREYLVKGFAMDDQRLKNSPVEGSGAPDYPDELLERIGDSRRALAESFRVKAPALNKNPKNIHANGELTTEATIPRMETVRTEGARQVARAAAYFPRQRLRRGRGENQSHRRSPATWLGKRAQFVAEPGKRA